MSVNAFNEKKYKHYRVLTMLFTANIACENYLITTLIDTIDVLPFSLKIEQKH